MKILLLKPYAAETRELELCKRVARPDTQITFRNIAEWFPIPHVHHNYFRSKAIDGAVEEILKAEEEGYDGVCIACGADPALFEARELVNIPITTTFEAGGHIASMMGHKFSVITTIKYGVPHMENLALLYGFGHKLASVRHLDIPGRNLRKEVTSPQTIVDRVNEVARRCVEEDGAEVILITATLAAVLFSEKEGGPFTDMGVPVVDAMQAGFKMVELMVDLQKLGGIPPVSRIGLYREPYEPEYRKLREYYGRPLRRRMDKKNA
jgi:allantoin racemase